MTPYWDGDHGDQCRWTRVLVIMIVQFLVLQVMVNREGEEGESLRGKEEKER